MPKVLLYITAKIQWIFLFWGTDIFENRAHVHIGKKGTQKFAKLWLEPTVVVADKGSLTDTQVKQITQIAKQYQQQLISQWNKFKNGKTIRIIKINKK